MFIWGMLIFWSFKGVGNRGSVKRLWDGYYWSRLIYSR